VPKPSDFFVGVTDFFAILLPGASVVYLLRLAVPTSTLRPWLPNSPMQGWAAFLVLAYIAGHLLHAIGSWLLDDYIYGKLYVPRWRSSHSRAAKWIREADSSGLVGDTKAAATLLARVYLTNRVNPQGTNYYDWCLSDLRVNSPAGAGEVDRLQADSKFFRSMVFVFLVAALLGLRQAPLWVSVGSAVLALFAIWRFCELRWSATKRVYEYYLLLHPPPPPIGSVLDSPKQSTAPMVPSAMAAGEL
jgi:hypothetical protein